MAELITYRELEDIINAYSEEELDKVYRETIGLYLFTQESLHRIEFMESLIEARMMEAHPELQSSNRQPDKPPLTKTPIQNWTRVEIKQVIRPLDPVTDARALAQLYAFFSGYRDEVLNKLAFIERQFIGKIKGPNFELNHDINPGVKNG